MLCADRSPGVRLVMLGRRSTYGSSHTGMDLEALVQALEVPNSPRPLTGAVIGRTEDCSGSRVVAHFRVNRSSADDRLQRPMCSERRPRCLVGRTVVDDLQGCFGQPERMRQQRSIGKVEQPDLKLKCQVVQ